MADSDSDSDTLTELADELAALVEPLALAVGSPPESLVSFMGQLGWNTNQMIPAIGDLGAIVAAVRELVEGDEGLDPADVMQLIGKAAALFGAIRDLSNIGGGLPGTIDLNEFKNDFPGQVVQYLVVEHLLNNRPTIGALLLTLGVIRLIDRPAAGQRPPYLRREIAFADIQKSLSDPLILFKNTYRWGQADLDGLRILHNLFRLGESIGIDVSIQPVGEPARTMFLQGANPVTEANTQSLRWQLVGGSMGPVDASAGIALQVLPAKGGDLPGLGLMPFANGTASSRMELSEEIALEVKAGFDVEGGVALVVRPAKNVELLTDLDSVVSSSNTEIAAAVEYHAADGGKTVVIGVKGGSRFEFGALGVSLGARMRGSARSVYGELALREAALVIKGGEDADGFLAKLLPDEIRADASLTVGLDSNAGLYFTGSGGLEIQLPLHIELGPLEILGATIAVKPSAQGIPVELGGTIKGNLGPLTAVVENVGMRATFSFPNGGGNLGPLDLALGFKPPNGVGLTIDAGVVKGGGYLYFDFDRGEYAGALELTISDFLSLKAIGLIATRMPDGSRGFSLLIIITAEFSPGLQLGYGFTLIGVGGLLGLNRTVVLEALALGVRTGALDGILFPVDPVANAPRIISDLRTIFPPYANRFLIGPMAKLGWGTPTLISLSLGVIIEIPGNLAILGVLKAILPDEDAALLKLQVNFIGAIEFDKKRGWFFAALYESRIVFITLEGEMGMLIAVGADANFLLSVGGFHPRFAPPPLPFPSPRRISFDIVNTPVARIRVEGYFAVTTNTVQAGARAELFFGFDSISVQGHMAFDALIRFSPFYFIVEISAGASLKAFGVGVFSIDLAFTLEGPTPWRARGRGSVSLLFIEISADFDVTWGESRDTTLPPILVVPLLQVELEKAANWRALPPPSSILLVSLRKLELPGDALVLHPLGTLEISQSAVPLGVTLDKVGAQKPADANRFAVNVKSGGLAKRRDARRGFAPAQFRNLKDAQKLSAPAFQDEVSGVELGVEGAELRTGRAVKRSLRYEITTIDTYYRRFVRRFKLLGAGLFGHFIKGSAVARSTYSQAKRKQLQPFGDRVEVATEQYAVVFTADNRAAAAESASFATESEAREWMRGAAANDPNLGASIHVVPTTEASKAA